MPEKLKIPFFPGSNARKARDFDRMFTAYALPVIFESRLLLTREYNQHGSTSCFAHCVAVAYYSAKLAHALGVDCDMACLVRGALLHDYVFYDWHDRDKSHQLHGFRHPGLALKNALEDFDLGPVEQNIILRHMFPLTPIPPIYRESLLVCLADKYLSVLEILRLNKTPLEGCAAIWQIEPAN